MMRFIAAIILGAVLSAVPPSARAFSLLGPFDAWQVANIGYQLPGDIGGPMNLGQEYRWDVPVIVYAFDQTFLNYFGSNGVVAVEEAIAILNSVPPASMMSSNLAEFPLETKRVNYQAQALGILDLKSTVLGLLVEELGLADPVRFAWTLRARNTYTAGQQTYTNYLSIKRNFDPVTWEPSSYVNGALYTYQIYEPILPGNYADAWESSVDPLAFLRTAVASSTPNDNGLAGLGLSTGQFFTGLTRDDVGGLRYLVRKENYNMETLPPSVTNSLGSGVGSGYTIYFPTNVVQQPGLTNLIGNLTNGPIVTGLRPGKDKLLFQRGNYDSLLGQFFVTNVYDYTDLVVTNYRTISQPVRRVVTVPDIVFNAGDLGVNAGASISPVLARRTAGFGGTNAVAGAGVGPGVIRGPITISFTTLLPAYYNDSAFFFLNEAGASRTVVWGSFNGSTNAPVIYPNYYTIRDIERMVTGQ